MNKKIILFFFLICTAYFPFAQTIKSPDEFLGYPLGSKYTPHHKIVSYFKYAVGAMPQVMKLDQYGETNEGRPLLLAYWPGQDFTNNNEINNCTNDFY
jgi:hypothetical protein